MSVSSMRFLGRFVPGGGGEGGHLLRNREAAGGGLYQCLQSRSLTGGAECSAHSAVSRRFLRPERKGGLGGALRLRCPGLLHGEHFTIAPGPSSAPPAPGLEALPGLRGQRQHRRRRPFVSAAPGGPAAAPLHRPPPREVSPHRTRGRRHRPSTLSAFLKVCRRAKYMSLLLKITKNPTILA
ncbi:hypothetical protein NDU88_000239 [Pleurodeles waltl]|uniref:Uncharacterized protein n=1 Tax=Pleurodeles waltl TaxID=8319 RepID=A0AAV7V4J8_PLEWA|nr:hypothetical protein NDU88_000239 [Pleurodeles waltl]